MTAALPIVIFFGFIIGLFLWLRGEVSIRDNQIIISYYLRKTKSFTFDYITRVERGKRLQPKSGREIETITAYHDNKKLFSVTNLFEGFDVLLLHLENEGVPIEKQLSFVQKKARKMEMTMNENDFIIRQPIINLVNYIIITVILFSIFYLFIGNVALQILPLLLGLFLIFRWNMWKIIVNDSQITVMPSVGRFAFDYITKVKRETNVTQYAEIESITAYHDDKKLFSLTDNFPGFYVLLGRLEKAGLPEHPAATK